MGGFSEVELEIKFEQLQVLPPIGKLKDYRSDAYDTNGYRENH
jgi:hypothetical protein